MAGSTDSDDDRARREQDPFSWLRAMFNGEEPVGDHESEQESEIEPPFSLIGRQSASHPFLTDTRRFHSHPGLDPRWSLGRMRPVLQSQILHESQVARSEAADEVLRRVMAAGFDVAAARAAALLRPEARASTYARLAFPDKRIIGVAETYCSPNASGSSAPGHGRDDAVRACNTSQTFQTPTVRTRRTRTPARASSSVDSVPSGFITSNGRPTTSTSPDSRQMPRASAAGSAASVSHGRIADDVLLRLITEASGRPLFLGNDEMRPNARHLPQAFRVAAAEEVLQRARHIKAAMVSTPTASPAFRRAGRTSEMRLDLLRQTT